MAKPKNCASGPYPVGLPPSPIQRLLVVHWNLHELCTSSSPSENASIEERSEEILYYHHNNNNNSSSCCPSEILVEDEESWNHLGNTTTTSSSSSKVEEAVDFWGLCKALYTLPEALQPMAVDGNSDEDDEDEDRTQSIYFGDSIIVFVPLEEEELSSSVRALAILQVSRLYQNGIKSDTGSANPLALRASVQRTHRLFCMLRGGGIVHRLKGGGTTTTRNGQQNLQQDSCPYPGMDELYALYKRIRKTTDAMARGGSSTDRDDNDDDDDEKVQELRNQVQLLQSRLPIRALRTDLESHYQEYLGHFLEVFLRHGGAGRCLVETMPIPIAHDSGSHTFQSLPNCFVDTNESFQHSIRTILQQSSSSSSSSSLLGIAVFQESQLLFSVSETYDLSCETVSLLMAHMASYRTRMHHAAAMGTQQQQQQQQQLASTLLLQQEPQPGLLKRWTSHIRPMVDEPPNSHATTGNSEHKQQQSTTIDGGKRGGRFVPSPPAFMLGAYDQTHSIEYGDTNIWAPRVHLPLAETSGVKETHNKCGQVGDDGQSVVFHHHLAVFEFMGFSFLLFLDLPPSQEDSHETQGFFRKLEDEFSGAVADAFHETTLPSDEFSSRLAEYQKKPGQDIVFLDRSKQRMVLLLNPGRGSSSKKPNGNKPPANNNPTRRFMGFGPKRRVDTTISTTTAGQTSSHRSTTLEWSAWGLDCRHLLASRLPLDVCLAFDDMIHETFLHRTNATTITPFENCTSVPHGWIYAFALDQKEIYVFFDNSLYVTVTDVQSAVLRIKEMFGMLP